MRLPRLLVLLTILACGSIGNAPFLCAADPAPASAPTAPPSLIGMTREEVIAVRGKPSGERDRGDVRLMVYQDGSRIELRGGRVVSVTGGPGNEIVGADGTRYVPGDDGNIKRQVEIVEPAAPAAPAEAAPPAPAVPPDEAGAAADPADAADDEDAGAGVDMMDDDYEEEELSPVYRVVEFIVGTILRFGLVVLILRLTLHFMGVPFFWPDLLKVSLLYLAVHEVLSGLGELGGLWEFIPLFRLDDITSFLLLACALNWFKIAGNGILALKIAVATKIVVYGLMLALGLVITLALSALQG